MKEYIEREAAFDLISDFTGQAGTKTEYSAYWKSANALKTLPAADVAPVVHGEWIEHGNWWGHIEYECSACKGQTFDASKFAYCPHCGARMDGGNK